MNVDAVKKELDELDTEIKTLVNKINALFDRRYALKDLLKNIESPL